MFCVYATWEGVNIRVLVFLCFIQTITTRKNQISFFKQFILPVFQRLWCKLESSEFIHTIINDHDRIEMLTHRYCHRGIIPEEIISDFVFNKKIREKFFLSSNT